MSVATSTQSKPSGRTALIIVCTLAVLAGFALLRIVAGSKSSPPAPTSAPAASANSGEALDDGQRYQIPVTMTQPSRGPALALATVVMWSDLGDGDRKAEPVIAALVQHYGDQLRLVFRHHLAHDQSARISVHELARIAHERAGKFWELRALVLKDGIAAPSSADLERYATAVGLDWAATKSALDTHEFQRHIAADGIFGAQFGVAEAPAFFVNGRRFQGAATLPRLERLIDQEIATAKQALARGVLPAALYTELTKDGLWHVGQTASGDQPQ